MRYTNPLLYLTTTAVSAIAQGAYSSAANAAGAHTEFTSTYEIVATPDQVVNANNSFTGGLPGARGLYKFSINSNDNIICYDITLTGFRGEYSSPAKTASHIHEAGPGKAGPPRIAFDNPAVIGSNTRRSTGCIQGRPDGFVTGVINATTGQDQGFGFHVKRIEENPTAFFADVHSSEAVPGAVRGQFPLADRVPAPGSLSSYPSSSVSGSIPVQTPSNCTGSCPTLTKVYEDCSTTPYGTGAWTPPATGGYTAPPPSGSATWVKPTGPTATSEPSQPPSYPAPPASSSVVPYTGAAVRQSAFSGLMLLFLGGLWTLV